MAIVDWQDYQERVANFFRSIGLDAETNAIIQGVRTKHAVDVLVKSHHIGFDTTWIVECKHWKSKVSKLHVLALREIVNETGADRGILLAESGFQSGATEAARLTNVQLTSLAEVMNTAKHEVNSMRLRDAFDLVMWCKNEYWEIPKSYRIATGLRTDVEIGYSGYFAIQIAEALLVQGLRGEYPFSPEILHQNVGNSLANQVIPASVSNVVELLAIVDPLVQGLEAKILSCKVQMQADNI
jgi:restriction system protein